MKRPRITVFRVTLLVVVVIYLGFVVIPNFRRAGIRRGISSDIKADLDAAKKVTLFEGLPHHNWESELLVSEKAAKPCFESHGHYFYSDPIEPTAQDALKLTTLTKEGSLYYRMGALKSASTCGGYHLDWFVIWTLQNGETYQLHLCFGCGEARMYGATYQYDELKNSSSGQFKTLLERYAKNRPPFQSSLRMLDSVPAKN